MRVDVNSVIPKCIGLYRSGAGFHPAEDQINSIEKAAKEYKLELVRIKDLSIGEIKQIDVLIGELAQKKIDCLMVWRLDCLAPLLGSFESIVAFISQLSRYHITFISVEDKIDSDDSASRVLINLHTAWVELKRNRKIENARWSSIKSKVNGNKPGPNKKRNDREIFLLRQKGLSIRQIAKETDFSPALIHQVLKKITQKNTESDKRLPTLG